MSGNPFSIVLCAVGRHQLDRIDGQFGHRPLLTCKRCHAVTDDDGQMLQKHVPERSIVGPPR